MTVPSLTTRRPRAGTTLPRLIGVLMVLAALLAAPLPARAAEPPAPLVVVGFSGVRWSDVSAAATPALASMSEGAIGTVAVRSVFTAACPADGWLGLSAGRRATAFDGTSAEHAAAACEPVADPVARGTTTVQPDFAEYRRIAEGDTFSAEPGTLGQALADAGTPTLAVGPGAGIALAGTDGTVPRHVGDADTPAAVGGHVQDALESGTRVVVVDAGVVRDPEDLPADETAPASSRAEQVAAVDEVVAAVQRAVAASTGADATTLLAVSLADAGRTAHLQFGAATGPQPGAGDYDGLLGSRSTRQTAIVQTTDLTPTVLALALGSDHGTPGLVGAPVTSTDAGTPAGDREEKVRDLDAAAQAVQPLVGPFFTVWGASQIVLYGVATLALRRAWGGHRGRRRVLAWLRALTVVFGAVCASTFLANTIPWWRHGDSTGSHLLAVTGAVALYVAVITALALLGPWRRAALGPLGFVGFVTAAVLAVDCATGSRLITSSLNGLQPVVAGRFYGLGNQQFALFATGSLLFTIAVADRLVRSGRRRAAVATVAGLGLVATYVDGVLGSDFGGPPAILPAFGFLTLAVAGVRITWRRVVVILGATVLVLAAISVADWLRPVDDQTHLGRFVQTLVDGGAWQVVERKAAQNLRILYGNWLLSLVLALAAVFIAFVLVRRKVLGVSVLRRAYERHPVLKPGLACLLVLLGIGFAVNDSGAAVPAVGAMLAVPLIIACCTRVLDEDLPDAEGDPARA
ncbi:conserved hypothetical protein [Kineococcus radiotolerans SRS30216 = ATCC BAA-149]|uniref:Uncharacterized protein n=1 Tax=Kineococcus radiotolerans (strain ATCC BAA-149 / DSM 14245 / SRS30216) TaxID=266940 RepID=A6W4J3_KINRD|nr:conserved hypothetical protein [Kineococcus radiotolerans SRS30216 = ATCC BAA-149]